ncbi:helix-turn-helix domain-containing protein [Halococcus hamelinensis]|uniref:DNA binding domain-containing protein n=1 Tax=Halococcus hamelinensis 100A6 TaxID=1132509 RepID=M0M0C1_9EURY|nr:helix-turn-helix domain-containing protein [Halococcus hamelinensis]EMA38878.1 DNA binding domain-containing protein [Halococcus hamelinensis 100A6]
MSNAQVVRGEIPAEEFALYEALRSLPDVEFEIERVVQSGDDAVMPLVWVRGVEADAISEALEADPSTRNISLLSTFENEQLYRMQWVSEVEVVLQMITNSAATVMDAFGRDGRWYLRVLYPDQESLTKTNDFVEENGLTFDVTAIRQMEGKPVGRYGLTEAQFEALDAALDAGYFAIPRETSLSELADQLEISHQALSERLRRATAALVEDALIPGAAGVLDERE